MFESNAQWTAHNAVATAPCACEIILNEMSIWKKLLWVVLSALGVWAMARLALSRGEQISALWIVLGGFCALSIS